MASQAGPVSALAERYATALLELAEERKVLDRVAADLEALEALLGGSAELIHLVNSPVIAREDRARAMQAVAERAGFSELTLHFIGVVARHGRLFALGAIAARFLAVLAERRGEATAEVTVAHELDEAQCRALETALGAIAGGKVSIDLKVDPDILGGLVVRLGSRLFDSSLGSRLRRLELSMKGA